MPSHFAKQNQQITATGQGHLNGGAGDSVVGGLLTGVPAGLNIGQGIQTLPGDRMILGEEDAAALTDTTVGTLYGGLYVYVRTKSTATAAYTKNRAVFWDSAVAGSQFQVTSDESGDQGVSLFAGVLIATLTAGYSWWIQAAGRVRVIFRAVLTGLSTDGCAVFLAAAGAGADCGMFDVLDGGGNPTFTQVGQMFTRYVGPAQTAPIAATVSTINIPLGRCFRW